MVASGTDQDMKSAPINPAWIRSGNPQSRNAMLSCSSDGMATTILWDCTAGEFVWHYGIDETIHFIEGSAIISDGHGSARRFGAGDVLFLPRGTVAHWHVDSYVRKIAFCRYTQPWLINVCMRAARKSKRVFGRVATVGGIPGICVGFALDNAWLAVAL